MVVVMFVEVASKGINVSPGLPCLGVAPARVSLQGVSVELSICSEASGIVV